MEEEQPLQNQIILIDKPKEWSSFDVVKKVRNILRIKKIGHAGTLDPLATGLLILCTGKATKQIADIQEQPKIYEVVFKLGATTASYDAEHPEEHICNASFITQEMLLEAMKIFTGLISQYPPAYSAVKVDGKRAYESARKGKEIQLKAREVMIYSFDLDEFSSIDAVKATIKCSKGTYIRSMIHDLGQQLGVGAYIRELRRTHIGAYAVAEAWQIEALRLAVLQMQPKDPENQ